MKIGILQTGYPPDSARPAFGNYADAFKRLLSEYEFEFSDWACLDGEFPPSVDSADGWLITGSKFGAYEKLPWIPTLESFLRSAYENSVPIAGICFGHQILAQALGGTVEKYEGGWSIGRVDYHFEEIDKPVPLYAWHQDQVIDTPSDATTVASTPFCKHAALRYGNKAFTVQPHPEFSPEYMHHLLNARRESLPADVTRQADKSLLEGKTNSSLMAELVAQFFRHAHSEKTRLQ